MTFLRDFPLFFRILLIAESASVFGLCSCAVAGAIGFAVAARAGGYL